VIRQLKRKLGRGEGGFSLIEGMLAAVILATGLLGLASMQGVSLSRNVDANEMTRDEFRGRHRGAGSIQSP